MRLEVSLLSPRLGSLVGMPNEDASKIREGGGSLAFGGRRLGVVLVFWSWREIVIDFTYVLGVQYSCGVVNITGKNYDRKKRYSRLAVLEYVSKYEH